MDSTRAAEGIEWLADAAASALLACAAGYAGLIISAGDRAMGASAAALGFLVAYFALRRVTVEPALDLPAFAVEEFVPEADDALLLLDDELPNSDVESRAVDEDPANALHAALADIRRSLR